MFRDFLDFLKEITEKFLSSRLLIIALIHVGLVCILLSRLYDLQIRHGEEYQENYDTMTVKTVSTPATRGKIFDRNGNLLAYNELC